MDKKMISVQINTALLERLKNVVYWTPGLTVRTVIESAITNELDKYELNNNAEPFQQRTSTIKMGSRVK